LQNTSFCLLVNGQRRRNVTRIRYSSGIEMSVPLFER